MSSTATTRTRLKSSQRVIACVSLLSVAACLIGIRSHWGVLETAVRDAGGEFVVEKQRPLVAMRWLLKGQQPWANCRITLHGSEVDDDWLNAHCEEINQLPNLRLSLQNTRVSGGGLASLNGSLSSLSLAGTPLSESDVAQFPNVGCLDIEHTGIPGSALSQLAHVRSLYSISIDATQSTREGVSALLAMPGLSDVTIIEADDESVIQAARLQGLRELTIFSDDVTSASLPALKQIQEPGNLTLYDTSFSDDELEELRKALPGCQVSQRNSKEWGYAR
jgi:hypothetical protein